MTTPPRPAVAALGAYPTSEAHIPGFEKPIQLGSNELGFAPSPKAVAAIRDAAGEGPQYPDAEHLALRAALAGQHGLDAAKIICGAGSMEIMSLLSQSYLEPGRNLVMSQYGYRLMKTLAEIAGADVILTPEQDLTIDVDAMLAAVNDDTAMVFVVNPNNPTGTLLPYAEVCRLRDSLPEQVMLVLDAAYGEFVATGDYRFGEALVDDGRNVVVLRTFSKVHGLAALRVGWAYAPQDVIETLTKMRLPGSIPTQSQVAAMASALDPGHVAASRDAVIALRERFIAQLQQFGLEPVPSHASFVLVRIPDHAGMDAETLYQAVKARGILLRRVGNFGLDGYLRISIGAPHEMAALTEALSDLLA